MRTSYTTGINSTYIATVEARDYPIFACQFHPEKNMFEWRVNAPHTLQAVKISQYFAD